MLQPTRELNDEQREIAKKSPYSVTKLVARNRFEIADYIESLSRPPKEDA